ncbi:MAG: F0F1 ATP synthase subunit epsilon [Sedimentisphaerales bacterium]|jgi:ATP synthase F1 epsilon subunit
MDNTFQCVVVAPPGKIIDCEAASIVFPAHDGMVGVLCDHMPMFCELGLGMMEIEYVFEETGKPQNNKALVVIDRGFALIAQNIATIVSNDAFSSTDIKKERIERVIERIEKKLSVAAYPPDQQEHEKQKVALLKTLLAGGESNPLDLAGESSP